MSFSEVVEMDSLATNPVPANLTSSNPGLSDALQFLTNSASPALASLLSSSSVKTALQQAPAADLVKLSDQALQLQEVDGLFGNAGASQTDSDSALTSLLAQLPSIPVSSISRPAVAAAAPAPSVASQLGIFEGQLQAENTQALFAASAAASGSNVNLLG
jgi:hypothetical protein